MRHRLATTLVVAIAILLGAAALLFAFTARETARDVAPVTAGSVEAQGILGLRADEDEGLVVYTTGARPPCGSCHTLAAAGSTSPRAVNLDDLRPTRRAVVVSIVGGTVGAHDAQAYADTLSKQQIADLAAFVAQRAGSGR